MLSPRKFAAGKKFLQRWQKAKKRQAKRGLRVESLEKRELMAADFHPSVLSALGTMRIPNQQTFQNVGNILENARTGGGGESYEGENNAPLTTGEVEPNNTRMQAQLLPLGNGPGQNAAVNVNGITSNLFDIDHYAFDLKKGDILDVRITTTGGLQPGLGLFNSQGRELLYSRGLFYPPAVGRPIPNQSPRFTTGNATLSYIIDTDGRYFLSVADANLAYSLNLRTYRPTIEQQPIGTKQILFLDFDGGFMRSDVLGLNVLSGQPARTVRVPAMSEILPSLNLRPEDEISLQEWKRSYAIELVELMDSMVSIQTRAIQGISILRSETAMITQIHGGSRMFPGSLWVARMLSLEFQQLLRCMGLPSRLISAISIEKRQR
jgi:hypothetical protein